MMLSKQEFKHIVEKSVVVGRESVPSALASLLIVVGMFGGVAHAEPVYK